MDLTIRLFATLKDRAGQERIQITLPLPTTVQTMLTAIGDSYPALKDSLPTALIAVNKDFAFPDTTIQMGDEIAIFPPVSGGDSAYPHPTYFAITPAALDMNGIHARLAQPDVGAVVSFTGTVRGQTQREGLPAKTLYLQYEAYAEMAETKMAQIAQEIWERWPLVKGVAIVQRIGQLGIGDITTYVACASGHRDQGVFEAARYGIDRLKEIVPVWKKEVGVDKSIWVEGSYHPTEEDNR